MFTLRGPDERSQAPPPDPVLCPLCGRTARFRGRRNRLQIYECVDDACMLSIFEVCCPPSLEPTSRRGGRG
jgi:hypothetical protein